MLPVRLRLFFAQESSGGIVMLLCAFAALILANSPAASEYKAFVSVALPFSAEGGVSLKEWVKNVPMVLFFLVVGLELKRELSGGFLSTRQQMTLPLLCAVAGMAVPALIYTGLTAGHPEYAHGWAIPAATDIAFALCVLVLVARDLPPAVKIFLLAIAIFDDLGAILVVAFFYSSGVDGAALGLAGVGAACLAVLNRAAVSALWPRLLIGVYLWFCFAASGVHTTVAGVILGLLMPLRWGLLDRCIHFLHPWVSFLVLPLFAFTSAGVDFTGVSLAAFLAPLPLGIAAALFFGKQIGIMGAAYIALRLKLGVMPEGGRWRHVYGVSVLAGIGFTMSLFIGALAFEAALQDSVKMGVLLGSLLAALWGGLVLGTMRRQPD